jgi:tRNA-specific 2-thiouridylase
MDGTGRKNARRVICAMSGGVDSSVTAALLKKAGLRPSGVFMRLNDFSAAAEKRAGKVAKILKIPFKVLDLRKEFKKKIIGSFLKECRLGLTPNPCVFCNKEIKFGLLAEEALKSGAYLVATGHYARVKNHRLLRGRDKDKDQSYFLWKLNQEQLKHILFPLGSYTKTEVKRMAKEFKLPVFEAPESQEICFIKTNINDFLKKHVKEKQGNITDKKGSVLGKHRGLWFYTIGQRKGIGLAGGPYFVLEKDRKRNVLVVAKNESDLYKKELAVKNVNWIAGKAPRLPLKIKAKIRYRQRAFDAKIYKMQGRKKCRVRFKTPQRAVTPGQSAVFYRREEVLGGGIIV